MKKTFIVLVMVVAMFFGLVGCCDDSQPREMASRNDDSSFFIVEEGLDYFIVYHKDTKVMYVVSNGYHGEGVFEVMVNADGTPMLYEED